MKNHIARLLGLFMVLGIVMVLAILPGCPCCGDEGIPLLPVLGPIELVSSDSSGIVADGSSERPAVNNDGRYVTFSSGATNLVANDTNGSSDIFLRDTQTDTITRVSVDSAGTEGNNSSGSGDLEGSTVSADGRYVVFASAASNLVANDTNGFFDIFLRDTQDDTTTPISNGFSRFQSNGHSSESVISADGRYVVFRSNATNLQLIPDNDGFADIFIHDTQTGTNYRASISTSGAQANSYSYNPDISADGQFVVFQSVASNLVTDDTNGFPDIFLRDTQAGTTTRVSVTPDPNASDGNAFSYDPAISADGRYVAFVSEASNLVAGDNNSYADVFVRDTQTGVTTRVSVASNGTEADNDSDSRPAISANGRYVAFSSAAENLVANDTNGASDIFVHDSQTGTTRRVSVAADGTEANDFSNHPVISADGNYVVFYSSATNLLPAVNNGMNHIFRAPSR